MNGLISAFDGETARERDPPEKGAFPVILGRVFVVVLFIVGILMLYQMHVTYRLLFNISAQLDKLDTHLLDIDTDKNLQEIMNLDWTCYYAILLRDSFIFFIKTTM